jgi:anti-sigma factor RsiW
MKDHTRIEELLALDALGGLDGTDTDELRSELDDHGPGCEQCAALRADFAETAGLLPFSLEPEAVRPIEPTALEAVEDDDRPVPVERRRRAWPILLAAAAVAAALVVGGIVGVNLANRGETGNSELAALLAEPGTRVVRFDGSSAAVAMAVSADGSRSYLVGRDLAAPPAGKVYEVWSIAGTTPTSVACVTPTNGSIAESLQTELAGANVVAVTIEDASCPSAPTTDPILTATLA